MSERILNLSYAPQMIYQGVKVGENRYLNVPQGTTSEEFKEYLKEYEPDTFVAIETLDKKLKDMPTQQCEDNILLGRPKMLKAMNPKTIKDGLQKIENFIINKTKKPPRITIDELKERYEKSKEILSGNNDTHKEFA